MHFTTSPFSSRADPQAADKGDASPPAYGLQQCFACEKYHQSPAYLIYLLVIWAIFESKFVKASGAGLPDRSPSWIRGRFATGKDREGRTGKRQKGGEKGGVTPTTNC